MDDLTDDEWELRQGPDGPLTDQELEEMELDASESEWDGIDWDEA